MKKISILVAAATCVCLMATNGFALSINDAGVVGTIEAGTQDASVDNVTEWANYLLGLDANKSVTEDGNTPLDGADEHYETSNTNYDGTLTGGLRINGATPDVSGYDWVLGKYDGQNAGYVLFNMAAWGGSSIPEFDWASASSTIWGAEEGQYQLSNVTVFGATSVPEPATMLLLGTGLISFAGIARKKFKTV